MNLEMHGKIILKQDIIGIDERAEGSAQPVKNLEGRAELSEVFIEMNRREARIVANVTLNHGATVVGRGIVDNEALEAGVVLPGDRIERRADKFAVVAVYHHDRHQRRKHLLCR